MKLLFNNVTFAKKAFTDIQVEDSCTFRAEILLVILLKLQFLKIIMNRLLLWKENIDKS